MDEKDVYSVNDTDACRKKKIRVLPTGVEHMTPCQMSTTQSQETGATKQR